MRPLIVGQSRALVYAHTAGMGSIARRAEPTILRGASRGGVQLVGASVGRQTAGGRFRLGWKAGLQRRLRPPSRTDV
jgi:hypothetical protein